VTARVKRRPRSSVGRRSSLGRHTTHPALPFITSWQRWRRSRRGFEFERISDQHSLAHLPKRERSWFAEAAETD
jgi:hypothetical protein